ncbi:hypothetical protein MCEMRE185_00219 [Candidatus Nanopelagicaceae bacterium]|jgi:hypothetical protein
MHKVTPAIEELSINIFNYLSVKIFDLKRTRFFQAINNERGDVPGWVLVVLMTTGLVTAIWTIAAPRLTAILKNSLDSMNGIR